MWMQQAFITILLEMSKKEIIQKWIVLICHVLNETFIFGTTFFGTKLYIHFCKSYYMTLAIPCTFGISTYLMFHQTMGMEARAVIYRLKAKHIDGIVSRRTVKSLWHPPNRTQCRKNPDKL